MLMVTFVGLFFGERRRNKNCAVRETKIGQKVESGMGAGLISHVQNCACAHFAEHLTQADDEARVANVAECFKHMSYEEMNNRNMSRCKELLAGVTRLGGFQETIGTPMVGIAYNYFGGVSPIAIG